MDPRSNSYITQQYSSRYVPNLSLQYSGSSQPHRPQFFPSSNHEFNLSPSRDRIFNPQVHLRPPVPSVLPPQIREATYSSNGQIFNPNPRHLSGRMPNFPSNMDSFNYAQRREEYPFRIQEHVRERHSNSHESGRSNPAWPSKVLDDSRIRFGSRDDSRMKNDRFSGSGRVSHGNESVDFGFSSSSMLKGEYKSEGKRGNIEGSDWVPMKPQSSPKHLQRKSAFQRIQKPVYDRLEEKPLGFTSSPRREVCGTLVPNGYEKLPPHVHSSLSSQPFYPHWSFKPKSSFVDHPGYSKRSSPSKLRPRNTKKRIHRVYEKPHPVKARKHDGYETSLETVRTLNRSDMTPRSKGKSIHDYAAEECGSHALTTLYEASKEGGLTAEGPKSSSYDVKLAQELTECNSTYVGSLSSSPSLSGRIKRVKPSPDSLDSYAKRSRYNTEISRMEESSRRLLLEDKIYCEGNVSLDQDLKNTINNAIIRSTPFDINVVAGTSECLPVSSDLIKDEKAVDSLICDKDIDGMLTQNNADFESSPNDETRGVANSTEKAVVSTFLDKDGEDKLKRDAVELESRYNDEMNGVIRSKYDSNKKENSVAGEKSDEVENVTYYVYECENPQKSVDEVIFCHQELRSPEIDVSNMTSEGGFTVETDLNIPNIASRADLPHSSSQTPPNEIVYSPGKLQLSLNNESGDKRVQVEDLNLKIEKAVKMIFESELFQDSFNDEAQTTMLYVKNQCTIDKIGDSPSKKRSSEVEDEALGVVSNIDHGPSAENISDSDIQKCSPEVLQVSLNEETQRTVSITNDESYDESASRKSASEDLQNIVNDATQAIADENHQSPAGPNADFAPQVCSSDVFQNSVNDEMQGIVSNVDPAPPKTSFEVVVDRTSDETQRTASNVHRHSPNDRVTDSPARKSSSSLEDNLPSNSSSLVFSGSSSSSESIPRSNSLRLQEPRRSPNSYITEDLQKSTKPSFKMPPSSKYPTKPRTWHRNSESSAPPPTNVASSSYIRKGNSLIRKPSATSSESFISIGSEDPQEESPDNTTSNPKNITYVKRKANQLVASVSELDHEIIPISTHKKLKKPKKLTRKVSRKQSKGTPITKQLVPWKWPSYRRKTLSQSQPTDEDPANAKSKHEFSFRKVKTLAGEHKYIRIGKGNKLVRETNKRTRILANEKIRWSLHTVRSRMSKKKKYCQFYTRFGKCNRTDGKCPYLHDPSKIAICTKFLSGLCTDPRCILTHKVMPDRMPDCSYFLQNLCNNGSCPYRHVHVDPNAGYCQAFLRGFCADGDECLMKHSYECPKYAETGSCEMGLRCRLHHPMVRSKGWRRQRLGLGAGQTRYFGLMRTSGSDPARVEKDEKLPDFISIDDSDDNCLDLGDDVEDDSIFPIRVMDVVGQ